MKFRWVAKGGRWGTYGDLQGLARQMWYSDKYLWQPVKFLRAWLTR